jgi:hypothetical protein
MDGSQRELNFLAKNPTVTEPTNQGVGPPPSRPADIMLVEIAKLQGDGEYIKRDLGEVRGDIRDARDRLTRLEERVTHLPGKGFIVIVVTTGLIIVGGFATVVTSLQNYLSAPRQIASPSMPATK